MSEGLRAAVGTDLLGLFLEPLLEASLAKMLTAAIREVRLVQYLGADHTLVIIREILHELILRHFASRYHMIKVRHGSYSNTKMYRKFGESSLVVNRHGIIIPVLGSRMRVRKVQQVDEATVEQFVTHEQIDKYTQEYNSLVFRIISLIILFLLSPIP